MNNVGAFCARYFADRQQWQSKELPGSGEKQSLDNSECKWHAKSETGSISNFAPYSHGPTQLLDGRLHGRGSDASSGYLGEFLRGGQALHEDHLDRVFVWHPIGILLS